MSVTYYSLSENETDFSKLFHNTGFDVVVVPNHLVQCINNNDLGNRKVISIQDGEPKQISERWYQTHIAGLILELKYLLQEKLHILIFHPCQFRNIFLNRADFIWVDFEVDAKDFIPVQTGATVRGKHKFCRSKSRFNRKLGKSPNIGF